MPVKKSFVLSSKAVLILICFLLAYSSIIFYPKWKKDYSEATISWDVSGYYHYLPATFIYHDLKKLEFQNDILTKYKPTPERQQSFKHDSGNWVMKYSCGQAVQMLPFFLIAHIVASSSDNYSADGYSRPYQLGLSIGSLLIAFIGLFYLRRYLKILFQDATVAIVLLTIGLATNYFEYAGITGAMTHNNLFTLYAILLYITHRNYISPNYVNSLAIGICLGLMALTRPTEIIAVVLVLFYGINIFKKESLIDRFNFLVTNKGKLSVAIFTTISICSLQFIYWKYVTGEWVVYSYEKQGFSWLKPHIIKGLFSFNNGWIPYSPIMVVSLIGLFGIPTKMNGKYNIVIIYFLLFIYIAFSWDIWWYGGSFGQRTMVQIYPVLAIPIGIATNWILKSKMGIRVVFTIFFLSCVYLNFWFVYQAHKGKMLHVEQMTKRYYWKTIGKWNYKEEDLKLLDNKDVFYGNINEKLKEEVIVVSKDTIVNRCKNGNSMIISQACEFSPILKLGAIPKEKKWLRASANVKCDMKEWNFWNMPQMIIKYHDLDGNLIKSNMIRLHRFLIEGQEKTIHMDSRIPNKPQFETSIIFWNAGSSHSIQVKDVRMISF